MAKAKKKATKSKNSSKKTDENRGSGERIPIQLLVDYNHNGNYLFDFCKDLGTGGLFINTEEPQEQGSDIELTFTIPDSKETITANGTVMWVQHPVESRKDLAAGMGVQFKSFSEEQRKTLADFVERYHSFAKRSGKGSDSEPQSA